MSDDQFRERVKSRLRLGRLEVQDSRLDGVLEERAVRSMHGVLLLLWGEEHGTRSRRRPTGSELDLQMSILNARGLKGYLDTK